MLVKLILGPQKANAVSLPGHTVMLDLFDIGAAAIILNRIKFDGNGGSFLANKHSCHIT